MRTILGVALAAALLAGLSAVPAAAADEPKKQQPLTWSVQPATAKGLDTRPNITRTVSRGQRVVDFVAVSNYSTKPLTLNLYATDAFNTDKGEFSLLPSATKPTDVGTWIKLKKKKLTVPARSKTNVPFSIAVPADAMPGDHTGGIVASLVTTARTTDTTKVALEQRAGTRVYLRVTGETDPALVVTDVTTTYEASAGPASGGVAVVTYTARNTGNTRLTGRRTVEVAGPLGLARATAPASVLPDLLPGEQATFTERIDGVRPLVRLTADVTIEPVLAGSASEIAEATGSAGTWAVSWILLAVVVLAALLTWFALRRRSRRKTEPSA